MVDVPPSCLLVEVEPAPAPHHLQDAADPCRVNADDVPVDEEARRLVIDVVDERGEGVDGEGGTLARERERERERESGSESRGVRGGERNRDKEGRN